MLQMKTIQRIIILGNSLQSLGAGLQAYQGIINVLKNGIEDEDSMVDKKNEKIIALIDVWIQAIGTAISAIGLTIIEGEERLEKIKI